MPCDTPPPPSSPIEDINEDDEDPDDSMYDFIEIDELEDQGEDEEEMPQDDSIATFEGHQNAVFCCDFDGSNQLAVSGGQDDTAFVWNVSDGSVKFECTGHSDSVIAAKFSSDSQYVATSDMKGLIQVWTVHDGKKCFDFYGEEIAWTEWLKGVNVLLAGSIDGCCWKFSIPDGATSVFENPGQPCTTGAVSHNDEMLVTGYSDGSLKLWNLSNETLTSTLKAPAGHSASVTAIKFNSDSSLILTGAEDNIAKLIRASDFKVLWSINCCDNPDANHHHDSDVVSVEDVGFCHNQQWIATGNNCGTICIWDMNTKTRRTQTVIDHSVIKVICDASAPLLYAATSDGKLLAIDTRNAQPVKYWLGHTATLLDFSISSDKKLFLTASDDFTCKVFERGDITL